MYPINPIQIVLGNPHPGQGARQIAKSRLRSEALPHPFGDLNIMHFQALPAKVGHDRSGKTRATQAALDHRKTLGRDERH